MLMNRKKIFNKIKRVIVKVGSNCLTTDSKIDAKKIQKTVRDVCSLRDQGYETALVSSGAISAGAGEIGLDKKTRTVQEQQASAAVGQIILMDHYNRYFLKAGIRTAQILVTESDLSDRKKYLNARGTLEVLFKKKVIPIINENDTVGISEIVFGDNDMLSVLMANLVEADALIVLTNVDGLLDLKTGILISSAGKIDDSVHALAGVQKSGQGRGGMLSKLKAMETLTHSGRTGVIANHNEQNVLKRILSGEEVGTFFPGRELTASEKSKAHKRNWLKYSVVSKGELILDSGAVNALTENKSLLATGIVSVTGTFDRGDIVDVLDKKGKKIARGIVNYTSSDCILIKGKKSCEFKSILGFKLNNEVLHRDNLVLYV